MRADNKPRAGFSWRHYIDSAGASFYSLHNSRLEDLASRRFAILELFDDEIMMIARQDSRPGMRLLEDISLRGAIFWRQIWFVVYCIRRKWLLFLRWI